MKMTKPINVGSLPARGAWIEIKKDNATLIFELSRSPQGERGLKSSYAVAVTGSRIVAPRKGSVD